MENKFLIKVLLGAFLGALAGIFLSSDQTVLGIPLIRATETLGELFTRALTMMVVPLVIASIVSGASRLGGESGLGKLGRRVLLCFFVSMSVATFLGILSSWVLADPSTGIAFEARAEAVTSSLGNDKVWGKMEGLFLQVIPNNVIRAAAAGEILGVIVFSALFGICQARLEEPWKSSLIVFWEGVARTMIAMTRFVMRFLPLGVLGLMAKATRSRGIEAFSSLGSFIMTVSLAFLIYTLILWPLTLRVLARVNPWKLIQTMSPALLTAFMTSSSAATLPTALERLEKGVGVSNRVVGLTLPLGISVNLSASALYAGAVVMFLARLAGMELDAADIALMFVVTLLTSFGMAGVPSASLISVMMITKTLGIPNEGIALVMAVERLADMTRTVINTLVNAFCATLVARWEGERTLVALGDSRE